MTGRSSTVSPNSIANRRMAGSIDHDQGQAGSV
jgi:hypothetical protein